MKTKTKITLGIVAAIIIVLAVFGANSNLFKGSMGGRLPFPKGGRLPADTRRPPMFEKRPSFDNRAVDEPAIFIASCSAIPSVINPTRGETSTISCKINERLPDGLTIAVHNSIGTTSTLAFIPGPVGVGVYSGVWNGRDRSAGIVPPGTYQYLVTSGSRNLASGNINVNYVLPSPPPPPPPPPPLPSVLTLIKNVVNTGGGTSTVVDFPLFINGSSVVNGVSRVLSPGDYVASEITRPGYAPSGWFGDCSADGRVTLNAGDYKTCRITNTYAPVSVAPTLRHWVANSTFDPTRGEVAHIFYDIVGTFERGLNISIRESGSGRHVKLLSGSSTTSVSTGDYEVTWDGRNDRGEMVIDGAYAYVFVSGTREVATGTLLVVSRPSVVP